MAWAGDFAVVILAGALVGCTPRSSSPAMGARASHGEVQRIDTEMRARMQSSWRPGCPVDLEDLRVVYADHVTFTGAVLRGALVVHEDVADDVRAVLAQLYAARYPIAKMVPIDSFGGDDDRSMAANNSSGFNCREVAGRPGVWSEHAFGRAIDLNPIQNPYLKSGTVSPPEGGRYVDRNLDEPGILREGDDVVRAFDAIGWHWGGRWTNPDYQHFSRTDR